MLHRLTIIVIFLLSVFITPAQQKQSFNAGWEFMKDRDTVFSNELLKRDNKKIWEKVSLPHTANIEPVIKTAQQWQGICFYRKYFVIPAAEKGKHLAIQFEAAMQEADVYLNGKHVYKHLGGYLPFYINISGDVHYGAENSIVVQLNNKDNPLIPPGKAIKDLDFNIYSGIYRNAWLIYTNKLHLTDAVSANKVAGGGILSHYENVTGTAATLVVQAEVVNENSQPCAARIRVTVTNRSGETVSRSVSGSLTMEKDSSAMFMQRLTISKPVMWSPDTPYCYTLSVEVLQNETTTDRAVCKTGVKTIRFTAGAFYLNGKKLVISGANRHQEYPYLGYALSDNAQYRDAWKIRQAGFNFVRCSYYPPSPAFLDACDELGILVMDAIPGWQFPGNEAFQHNSFQNARDMIRRDRNHPSIILWEASLNESGMKVDYMQQTKKIVHEELPFENVYAAGWIDTVYDVFLPARQHAKAPDYWKKYAKNIPLLIAEYGDWEYYAQNAGFNQKAYQDLKTGERSSRQLRGSGEKHMLQQALNFQEAHNDNLYGPAIGDVIWLMFDYKRGYADDLESSGIMDIFRLPKFVFYFFQSQTDAAPPASNVFAKPMVFIASYWQDAADTVISVYSNCEEVQLLVNGTAVGRQRPDSDRNSNNLAHPPFTFHLPAYHPGSITARGFIGNKTVAQQVCTTPAAPASIRLRLDESGKRWQAGKNDVVFLYADIIDKNGTIVPGATNSVMFSLKGDAEIVGVRSPAAEAGTAAIVAKAGTTPGSITITASAKGLLPATIVVTTR